MDRFLLTVEQYSAEGLKDRFGDTFLTFNRQGIYFNKNWELNFKRQKADEVAQTSPYSERSLASKKQSISNMIKRRMSAMPTPTMH